MKNKVENKTKEKKVKKEKLIKNKTPLTKEEIDEIRDSEIGRVIIS